MNDERFCADSAEARGESLAATASRVVHWLLIEYRGRWERDAVDGSLLEPEVKAHLLGLRRTLRSLKILFVRRSTRDAGPRRVFFAVTREGGGRVASLQLERYADLLALEAPKLVAGTIGAPVEHPLVLVCTHGKHDACCARRGQPLYRRLREELDDQWLWQVSHVGGDRFAANVVALPEGTYHGRVETKDAGRLVAAIRAREVYLPCYRGRSCHDSPVQAAEIAVRERTGLTEVAGVRVQGVVSDEAGWRVTLEASGVGHTVEVEQERSEAVLLTCGAREARVAVRYVTRQP